MKFSNKYIEKKKKSRTTLFKDFPNGQIKYNAIFEHSLPAKREKLGILLATKKTYILKVTTILQDMYHKERQRLSDTLLGK